MAAALDYTYQYPFASALETTRQGPALSLATFTRADENPYFFDGRMRDPRVLGVVLIAPHFFTEPEGLASIACAREAGEHGDLRERLGWARSLGSERR